jgi:hypothetical protein
MKDLRNLGKDPEDISNATDGFRNFQHARIAARIAGKQNPYGCAVDVIKSYSRKQKKNMLKKSMGPTLEEVDKKETDKQE